jgi:hypothetical protein
MRSSILRETRNQITTRQCQHIQRLHGFHSYMDSKEAKPSVFVIQGPRIGFGTRGAAPVGIMEAAANWR